VTETNFVARRFYETAHEQNNELKTSNVLSFSGTISVFRSLLGATVRAILFHDLRSFGLETIPDLNKEKEIWSVEKLSKSRHEACKNCLWMFVD